MLYGEPEQQLTDEEFRLIRDLIYNHCGLFFVSDSKYLLDRRLVGRLAHHNLAGFLSEVGQMERIFASRYSKLSILPGSKSGIQVAGDLMFIIYTSRG